MTYEECVEEKDRLVRLKSTIGLSTTKETRWNLHDQIDKQLKEVREARHGLAPTGSPA